MPSGQVTRVPSPDALHVLVGVPYQSGVNDGPQLWIENAQTHERTLLVSIGSTLSASWSLDGSTFWVVDSWASDRARAFLYTTATLQRLDLGSRILAVDADAQHLVTGHAYFDSVEWENPQQVRLRFHGHTDEPPVRCFDFRYRVTRSGAVVKLSGRTFPINAKTFCE